ncbi:TetR/AcrR family transcriptional regulator [Kineococcus indalonis]|uniref:TetR/AcrR family transcriptional regulator n=1 Tax=Kineococcus indalonis TaxID=2696566 RepID=UPI001412B12F|nr:TetR/AcrR family transcriptional regulator [Kineococcus indalonis]NAZ85335.1 TetR family transcriptional regulator [Kineococcus indalonis]
MRTVDPEQHRRRRHEIVEAAVELFARKGFEATTTADICRAAGISTGRLFHYFPSKQAVFHAIFELDRAEQEEALARAVHDPDPWRGLTAVVERLWAETTHPVVAGLFVEVVTQAHRDPVVTRLVAEDDRRALDGVAALVERLVAAGRADPAMPPQEAARWVLTLAETAYGRGYPEPERDRDADRDTALELVARVLRLRPAPAGG